jgi:ABC-type amino acid transport substrate-binding protein
LGVKNDYRRRIKMKIRISIMISSILLGFFIFSCAAPEHKETTTEPDVPPLRVGITADYKPMIFISKGQIMGIEADFARLLAKELDRPLKFVELSWNNLISALTGERIDIVMAGMSVTKARGIRVDFAEPYLKSGLLAAMRVGEESKYTPLRDTFKGIVTVGVVEGTTGDIYIQRNAPNIRRVAISDIDNAAYSLERGKIDLFIHDAPAIIWLISKNEASLTGWWEPLNEEDIAWGVRKGNEDLLDDVNGILKKWKVDGTLEQVLLKWLPEQYFQRLRSAQ